MMPKKATNRQLDMEYLHNRSQNTIAAGYSEPKWIYFCKKMLRMGFQVYLYEARKTNSKYCTVKKDGKSYKVRFSDHKPIKQRELRGDCDFFVGKTNYTISNTDQAVQAVTLFFGVDPSTRVENSRTQLGLVLDFI